MKTLILMASPKKDGNTSDMVQAFVKNIPGAYEVINVYKESVKPCVDCKYCSTSELKCSINDNMSDIYDYVNHSDNIVIASPVYFGGFPAPLKTIIDRFQIYWSYKYSQKKSYKFKKKRGILLLNCGAPLEDMFIGMEKSFDYLMKSLNGEVISQVFVHSTDRIKFNDNKRAVEEVVACSKML
ncbi:flavodoxin family protein [Clostridium sediminicola]|uniref:flavodoxin family protein n=1 Tax=Clostridium sediminicola TaxID=3114879 RepID=UPI0031F24407